MDVLAAVPVGKFVTGDPYVVGAVTITAISPQPANGRNGSVKNLPPVDDESGFDSRTEANRYESDLSARLPINLVPGDSLVSSISLERVGSVKRWLFDRSSGSPVRSVSVLTSVRRPQPPDAFRPSYAGRGSPIFLSRNLRRGLLPRLRRVSETPSLAEYEQHFRRPWVDNLFFNFDSPVEYMPDYSREIARAVGMAGLLLTLDYTPRQKEALLVYVVAVRDRSARAETTRASRLARARRARKWTEVPDRLRRDDARQPGDAAGRRQVRRGHADDARAGWTGAKALYAGHYGRSGEGKYGPYEHLQPRSWPDSLGEDYRRCCTSSAWIGEALAARLVPGVRKAWNHAPFFEYADRWMTEDDCTPPRDDQVAARQGLQGLPAARGVGRLRHEHVAQVPQPRVVQRRRPETRGAPSGIRTRAAALKGL